MKAVCVLMILPFVKLLQMFKNVQYDLTETKERNILSLAVSRYHLQRQRCCLIVF